MINLICGDAFVELKKISPQSVHLVVTDPPYFLDGLDDTWKKGLSTSTRGTGSVGGLPVGMKFDVRQGKRLQEFIYKIGELIYTTMFPGAFGIFFSHPRLVHRMAIGLEDAGFEIRDLLVWHFTKKSQMKAFSMDHFVDKMNITNNKKIKIKQELMGRKTPQLRPQFQCMILIQKPREGTFINNWLTYKTGLMDASTSLVNGLSPSTMMSVEKPSKLERKEHLTVKPIKLIEHIIALFSLPNQLVLDPFVGSGTTAVAANRLGRQCVGIEINKEYIDIVMKKL